MADTTPAAPATDTPPRGLTNEQAVAEMARRRQTAPAAPVAAAAEPVPTAETDNSPAEPDEAGVADVQEADAPAPETEQEADGDDPVFEAPDGTKVTLSELWKGHLRQADYTKKTQALAEERRALDAQRQSVEDKAREVETGYAARIAEAEAAAREAAAERQRYSQSLDIIGTTLANEDQQWSKVDWDAMEAEDPIRAGQEWRKYQRHLQAKQALESERHELARKAQAEQGQLIEHARRQLYQHITAKHPEVVSDKAQLEAMRSTAIAAGYTDDDIANSLDPRGFDLWRKATLYDQLMAKQAALKASPNAPKPDADGRLRVVNQGAARPRMNIPPPDAALGRAKQALQRTGSVEDAVALMQARRAAQAARQGR